MKKTNYIRLETKEGIIYLKEEYEEQNEFKINSKLYELDTNEPVELIQDYIKFTNLGKCIRCSEIIVNNDESIEFIPYEYSIISKKEVFNRTIKALEEGISLIDETYKTISKGITEEESKKRVSQIVESKLEKVRKSNELAEKQKRLKEEQLNNKWETTFNNVFGDLFEDENRLNR